MSKLTIFMFVACCVLYSIATPNQLTKLFRMYNPTISDHFYTADSSEATRAAAGGYKLEGSFGLIVPNQSDPNCPTLVPIYRSWNNRDHFYTTNQAESNKSASGGYRFEGITGYCVPREFVCDADLKIHRFWFQNGDHFYTTSEEEAERVKAGCCGAVNYEGVTCYIWNN